MKKTKKIQFIIGLLYCALFFFCVAFVVNLAPVFRAKAETVTYSKDMYCAGASIRLSNDTATTPDGETCVTNGIRFHVRISSDEEGKFDGYTVAELNKLETCFEITADNSSLPEDLKNDLTEESQSIGRTGGWIEAVDGSYVETKAYVYDISAQYYEMNFTYRAYYVADGEKIYAQENGNNTRSVSSVALEAKIEDVATKDAGGEGYTGDLLTALNDFLPDIIGDITFENTDKYLYRVGNQNNVALSSLFSLATENDDFYQIVDVEVGGSSIYEKDSQEILFAERETGVKTLTFKVKYSELSDKITLPVEVVNATNVTAYSELKNQNSVLLDDITMSSGGSYYLSNATLYGNGFTFDVTDGGYSGTNLSSNYLVNLSNATLDNVNIVGAVYTSYGATVKDDYNRALVLSTGNSTIVNSYLSNCAAPVRVNGGNLEIIQSTIKGGNFANIDIRGGHVVLDNVTTINQVNGNDTAENGTVVVGLGVVVYYENVADTTTVEIKNGITQYNHLSNTQAEDYITDSTASSLTSAMFDSKYSAIQYNDGSDTWINTGILSMTENVGNDNITDVDGYTHANPSMTGVVGYLHTKTPDATSIAKTVPGYMTAGQGAIAPSYSFDYTTKNYIAKTDGSNDYCYEDGGSVYISMDKGDSFPWDTSILTATKNGETLDYTVSMNGTDYTGKSITFDTAGDYEVIYTYTDSNNYTIDESGNITTYGKTYAKTVHINVAVIEPDAKNAEFKFGSSETDSTEVTIGNDTYVMPKVAVTSSTIGSITVSDTTVYYPIVEAYTSDGKTGHSSFDSWYMCFPVFKNVVTITDYANSGTGSAITYNGSTTSMPSGLSLTAYSDYSTSLLSGAVKFTSGDAGTAFKYQASSNASTTPTTLNDVLIYASPSLSNNERAELYLVVQYKYQDNAGATYYYYVGYHMPQTTVSSGDSCLAEGTLITMADGTKKAVQDIRKGDVIMAFDHVTGTLTTNKVIIVVKTESEFYKNTFIFDDGTELATINEHGIFDLTLNKYVNIDHENYKEYIGHDFISIDKNGNIRTKQLIDLVSVYESGYKYDIVTNQTLNYVAEDTLSVTHVLVDIINTFEFGEKLTYNQELMQADIEKYGLYMYEEWAEYCDVSVFEEYNIAIMKIGVSKGLYTKEYIISLINTYVLNDNVQIID